MTDQSLLRRLTLSHARKWWTLRSARRQDYKRVWSALSLTEDFAKAGVQGTADEGTLERSAAYDVEHRLNPLLHITNDDAVLEIGCGVGRLGKVIAPMCRHWTGCDVSPRMLGFARARLSGLANVSFVEVSGFELSPVPNDSQDVVYSTVVFMHLAEWDRFGYVEEARRVLKPGGRLYIDNIALTTEYGWRFFSDSRHVGRHRPPHVGSVSTQEEFGVYLARAGFSRFETRIVDDAWVVGYAVK